MALEEFTAQLNCSTFWREFTFSQNLFSPQPGQEVELADNIVWLGETLFIIQMKERQQPTNDVEVERRWFEKKIRRKAVSQIKDSLRFLEENNSIGIINGRGHLYEISSTEIHQIEKIVLYSSGPALPKECRAVRFHSSETAGFIHVFERDDYRMVIETLAVPEEVRLYLGYRKNVLLDLCNAKVTVSEADILAAYMSDEAMPTTASHKALSRLLYDADQADLSPIMHRLADNIQRSESGGDYTRILLEFAKLPRSGWRAAKERLDIVIKQAQNAEFERPYRFTFPATDCSFAFSPHIPEAPTTGIEGERARITFLQNLTAAAKHLAKASKGVGVLASKDRGYVHLDWCLIDHVWEHDPDLDRYLEEGNLFGTVREKKVYGYYFVNE